ncbi:hypothetical protein ACU988_002809 [Acinetobacter baumannii]|uniref:hypothetical protein n=2 Tax=Acinetobacter baumannii TaxID=470 RepID=UPI0009F13323|nr:hypothetical protein [Acinetobacter baumannii]EHU2500695.1 hypothetical protein [Acinetobacter baumannii]EMC5392393.1 hypothetical protein [Acinetobacter baumannii]MCF4215047.1 hypothetical protein [Acinetobacter baumannii]MCK0959476.1 hypothetical protein [Acinetobacter baumannii]MDA5044091.1 hypothetical protein [Acinetobacter baumannii]
MNSSELDKTITLLRNNPESICLQYLILSDDERKTEWTTYSHALAGVDTFFVITVQQIGWLDARLVFFDKKLLENGKQNTLTDIYLNEQLAQSFMWVLAAYEIIRTLNDDKRPSYNTYINFQQRVMDLKHKFERIRIPLAKFEPSRKHKTTDSSVAYPTFSLEKGVAWQVSDSTYITRRELSDEMLELFKDIHKGLSGITLTNPQK